MKKCKNCKKELSKEENDLCRSCMNGMKAKYKKEGEFVEALERILDYRPDTPCSHY